MSTAPDNPASPSPFRVTEPGLTAREHAALTLRVPDSGNDWLDAMIRTAQRNDLAAQCLTLASDYEPAGHQYAERIAARAYHHADAMLSAAATQRAEGE